MCLILIDTHRGGDKVTIDAGKEVVLDVNTPPLNGLTINGKLSFANNKDVELTTEWIMLQSPADEGSEVSDWQQFTGLIDKNGREIYEGDIVRKGTTIGTVVWSEHTLSWMLHNWGGQTGLSDTDDLELLGNMMENPKSLKVASE